MASSTGAQTPTNDDKTILKPMSEFSLPCDGCKVVFAWWKTNSYTIAISTEDEYAKVYPAS